jgi:hypothetical protein
VKVIEENTTLVLAGAFNPAILTPKWVAVHGLGYSDSQEFQVEMLSPIGGALPSRFSFDGFSYSAAYNLMTLHLKKADLAQSQRSIGAMAEILSKLSHTPINGLGFNFGFLIEEPTETLLQLLTTHDPMTDSFSEDAEVVTRKWGNVIKWENSLVSVDCESAGGQVTLFFNFHYSIRSAMEAEQILREQNIFEKHLERAVVAAKALSGQDLEG